MKKLSTLVLGSILTISLCACGGSAEPAATKTSTAMETQETSTAPATTEAPETTDAPETTSAPTTTEAPETTTAPAATDVSETTGESLTEEYKDVGVNVTYPESFKHLKGQFIPYPVGRMDPDVYLVQFCYCAMDENEYNYYLDMDDETFYNDPEIAQTFRSKQMDIGFLEAVKEDADPKTMFDELDISTTAMTEVGRHGDLVWYYANVTGDSDAGDFDTEYKQVGKDLGKALADATYYEPLIFGSDLAGKTFSFEAVDTEGKSVSSEEIFSKHAFTMVNCWGTFCGPCINELEELVEMNKSLTEKDCAIIGIMLDATDEETVEKGKKLMAEHGVDYLVLLPNEQLEELFDIESWPTSYFFDSSGTLVEIPFVGASPEAYEEIFADLLAGRDVHVENGDVNAAVANDEGVYRVVVTDSDGTPVEGATVQFCDDNNCVLHKTGADGVAVFEADEGSYAIHVIKVPDGFEPYNYEVATLDTYSDVYITLKNAE